MNIDGLEWPMTDGYYRFGGDVPHATQDCFLLLKGGKISGQVGYAHFDGAYQKDGQNIRGHYSITNLSNHAVEHPRGNKVVTLEFAGTFDNSGNDIEARAWFAGSPGAKFSLQMALVCDEHEDPVVIFQLDDGSIGPKSMKMLERFANR